MSTISPVTLGPAGKQLASRLFAQGKNVAEVRHHLKEHHGLSVDQFELDNFWRLSGHKRKPPDNHARQDIVPAYA